MFKSLELEKHNDYYEDILARLIVFSIWLDVATTVGNESHVNACTNEISITCWAARGMLAATSYLRQRN